VSEELLSISEALHKVDEAAAALGPMASETVAVADALHRVLAVQAESSCDLPPFDQSAMDGYAVRADDLLRAPLALPLQSVVAAGPQAGHTHLEPGKAVRIFTGGLMPVGADTVIMQEWTRREGDQVWFDKAAIRGSNVRHQGEEVSRGAVIAPPGIRVTPGLIGALSAAGVAQLEVVQRPRVEVLVTGDEIVAADAERVAGEVFDANGPLLKSWFQALGHAEPIITHVTDTQEATRTALATAFDRSDLVISTGGVSVGDRDLVAPEAEGLGAERVLWKVAQKPGKPMYVARREHCLLIGLPGNPGAVLINLAVFVRRALDRMEGLAEPGPHWLNGRLAVDTRGDARRDSWLRMKLEYDGDGVALLHPLKRQASHMMSNLAQADALVWLPASEVGFPEGTRVRWQPLYA